ncbi:MAG: thioredoxin family protein [Acidimicrobiales bacterium]
MSTVEEIKSMGQLNEVLLAEDRGVVLDFWGTWCQPCRALKPHLEQLATDHADSWRVVSIHAEENVDIVESYDVQSTPTLIYIRGGDEVFRSAGAVTPSSVSEALGAHA